LVSGWELSCVNLSGASAIHHAVDIGGCHALSSSRSRNPGRTQRHHFVNDLIWRSLSKAGFPSIKELQGLLGSDGKPTDGLTLISWQDGRCATWDVPVTGTDAAGIYVSRSIYVVRWLSSRSSAHAQRGEIL